MCASSSGIEWRRRSRDLRNLRVMVGIGKPHFSGGDPWSGQAFRNELDVAPERRFGSLQRVAPIQFWCASAVSENRGVINMSRESDRTAVCAAGLRYRSDR